MSFRLQYVGSNFSAALKRRSPFRLESVQGEVMEEEGGKGFKLDGIEDHD